MLKILKITHTFVWLVMTVSNFAAFYFAFIGDYSLRFWIPASLLMAETAVIIVNRWKCPLTGIAERLTAERRPNFDIYLPEWLAKYNKEIFTALILIEILIVVLYGAD